MGLLDSSTKAFKQRRGTYFYYNRAAIGLACAQATAMRSKETYYSVKRERERERGVFILLLG
jgi:uncharacterized protein YciW